MKFIFELATLVVCAIFFLIGVAMLSISIEIGYALGYIGGIALMVIYYSMVEKTIREWEEM